MKNIDNFIGKRINEYRTAGSKNKSTLANVDMDKIEGKPAEKNGTDGKMGYEEPVDDSAIKGIKLDPKTLSTNKKRLMMKFEAEDDFFIVGRAGWGKTSIINNMAEKYGYKVIPFYLDKCEAVDLGGMPVNSRDKNGRIRQEYSLPAFVQEIADNEDKKFLLFFDEMNQASPDVQNALMPIILEHEIAGQKFGKRNSKGEVIESNFFCGAAGNFEDENDAVYQLSGPLKSRFKPLIVWETGTDEAWSDVFDYLHKKWDDKISKELIDAFEKCKECFENPREIEQKVIEKYIWKMIQKEGNFDTDMWEDHLQRIIKDDLDRSQKDLISKLAEAIYKVVDNHGKWPEQKATGRGGRKDMNQVPQEVKDAIKHAMKFGYVEQKEGKSQKVVRYGISRENIGSVVDEEDANAEMVERIINKFEEEGIKWKYQKDEEWRKAGLKDPDAEDEE